MNINSEEFKDLSVKEKRRIAIEEFTKCKNDFAYFLNNYGYIRHPNAGIIKVKPFDFQFDVALPIATALKLGRSDETSKALKEIQPKFDYEKWFKKISEKNIELTKKIPSEFQNYYKNTCKHPDIPLRIDTIILKSRQTGLSTIFELLGGWHINFYPSVYDIVISQRDKEAMKFLNDVITWWELIPPLLRGKKLTGNQHQLWVSITGQKSHRSGFEAFPPVPDAGRSYSPNLVIMDEFAMWRRAGDVWTAVTSSVSGGGIIVVISTPKGVGNLYHRIWELTNKSLSISFNNEETKTEIDNPIQEDAIMSSFKPMVVHWSQMPEEEFIRRGFKSSLDWYNHMKGKIAIEKGAKAVAQELELDFLTSGETIDVEVLNKLRINCLELRDDIKLLILKKGIPGLVIYEKPQKDVEYLISVDVGEGILKDYSVLKVFKLPTESNIGIPKIVAKLSTNNRTPRQFKDLVKLTGKLYNNAWLHIERNNHGQVLLSYLVEDNEYILSRIINRYNVGKSTFDNGIKGWGTTGASRNILIANMIDFIYSYPDDISLPKETAEEFKTFINKNGRWEAQSGYHDDCILSLSLGLMGYRILDKYKEWIRKNSHESIPNNIEPDMYITSSNILPNRENRFERITNQKKEVKLIKKDEDLLREAFDEIDITEDIKEKRPKTLQTKKVTEHKFISQVNELSDEVDFIF